MFEIAMAIMAALGVFATYFKISSDIKQSTIDVLSKENSALKENAEASKKQIAIHKNRAKMHRETAKKILQSKVFSEKEVDSMKQEIEYANNGQNITLSL